MPIGPDTHEQFRLTAGGPFKSSDGWVSTYLDAIGMILNDPGGWTNYFNTRIEGWPIGLGTGGAVIVGLLWRGSVLNLNKNHGLRCNGGIPSEAYRKGVTLVDDSRFTGATMREGRLWCEAKGLTVIKEVVAYPWVNQAPK